MPAPASHVDYPALADAKVWLNDAKMLLPSDTGIQNHLNDAISDFERLIGRRVLSTTQTFTLPARGQYIVALPQSANSITSVTVLGTLLSAGNDYDPMSYDGNPPYDWIEFTNRLPQPYEFSGSQFARKGVVVVGVFGLDTVVPDLAWNAILSLCMYKCIPGVASATSLGRAKLEMGIQQEYFNIRGDGGPYQNERLQWAEMWKAGVLAYQRLTVGMGG